MPTGSASHCQRGRAPSDSSHECFVPSAPLRAVINNAEIPQRAMCFSCPSDSNGMHAKSLCSLDINGVVVEKQHLSGRTTERVHHMLKRIRIRLNAPGQMRRKVAVECSAEAHVIHDTRPMQSVAIRKYCAPIRPRYAGKHFQSPWIKPSWPRNECLQESLRVNRETKL